MTNPDFEPTMRTMTALTDKAFARQHHTVTPTVPQRPPEALDGVIVADEMFFRHSLPTHVGDKALRGTGCYISSSRSIQVHSSIRLQRERE